jgi:hypothetical protein
MLSKCANPVCSNTFLYLRQGKLFRLEVPVGDQTAPDGSVNAKTSPNGRLRDEYFWLCETCCPNFKVVREQGVGLKVIPFNGAEPLGRDFQPGPREGRDVGTPNNRMKTDGSKSRIKGKLQRSVIDCALPLLQGSNTFQSPNSSGPSKRPGTFEHRREED